MKTCPSCGAQVPEDGKFCTACGAEVGGEPTAAPMPTPPEPAEPPGPDLQPPAPPAPAEPPIESPATPATPAPGEPPAPPAPAPEPQAPTAATPPYQAAAPAQYPQQYAPPAPGTAQPPKKRGKGLLIAIIAVVLLALLACCAGGAWLVVNSDSSDIVSIGGSTVADEDTAKVETIESFAIGLGTMDFDLIRSVIIADAVDELDAIEASLTDEDIAYLTSTLLSSEWDGDTLLMSFEDTEGYVSYIRIYPPDDGGTELYTDDWDEDYTEDDAIRTYFELVDEDGWKVYAIDGETLDVYFSY